MNVGDHMVSENKFINMLSIEQARKILNDPNISDKEIEEIRDGFRMLAEIIFEKWQQEKQTKRVQKQKKHAATRLFIWHS